MSEVTVYHYENAELTASINKEHEILNRRSKDLGIDLASRGLPETNIVSVIPYIASIKEGYHKLIQTCKRILTPEMQGEKIDVEEDNFLRAEHKLKSDIETASNDIRVKQRELKKADNTLEQKAKRWNRVYRPFTWLIVLSDVAISGVAIQQLKYSLWLSILLAICIGASILMAAHHLPNIINKGKTPKQKKKYAILTLGSCFIIFLVLGFLRSMNIVEYKVLHTFGFAVLNFFLLSIAVLVSYFNKPTPQEFKIIDQYKQKAKDLQISKQECEILEKELFMLREAFYKQDDLRKRIIQYAKDTELLINSLWSASYTDFIQENLFHRQDGAMPTVFNEKPEPLTMFYQQQL